MTFGCFCRLSSNVGSFTKQVSAIFVVNRPLSSFCSRGSSWQRESLVIYRVVLQCIGRKQTTFLYERQDADKENWLLYGKCKPVIILSAVGHPTNVIKFQPAKASMIAKIPSKKVNINASHRFARAIMNDTNKSTL